MPIYVYRCMSCLIETDEIYQHITDKPLKKCKICGKFKLERLLFAVDVSITCDPKTIYDISSKNRDSMSSQEYFDKTEGVKLAQLEEVKKELPSGMKLNTEKTKTPWWRKGKINTKLMGATPKEQEDYVFKGVTPSDKEV